MSAAAIRAKRLLRPIEDVRAENRKHQRARRERLRRAPRPTAASVLISALHQLAEALR